MDAALEELDAVQHASLAGWGIGPQEIRLLANRIATNTTLVTNAPTTFADLEKPEYKGQVTLNGDPREAGAAFAAVMAASLALSSRNRAVAPVGQSKVAP